jgi:solute carrier family 6 (neurotransmitter transporter, amino acid/orphan) member 15/16/17/18/20
LPWANCPTFPNGTIFPECERSSETEYFWYRSTLDAAPSIDDNGGFKWWIIVCLLIAWIVVFFIVMKGIQSSGKAVYFTSLFPYVVLTIFFIRGITLEGASAGIVHMYTPKVEKLFEVQTWLDAATQVFYSFGLAFGSLIAFGSYNTPKNNCVRDVLLVSVCNAVTAIYASVVIFSILGYKATRNVERCFESNLDILRSNNMVQNMTNITHEMTTKFVDDYLASNATNALGFKTCTLEHMLSEAAEGTGLAFIVFTQAIVELPGSPIWAVLFFTMLLSLGLGSQIGILEGMLCTIFDIDFFKRVSKPILTGVVCVFCCSVGFIFTTGAGEYWLTMFDSFAGTLGLVVVAFMEMVAVVYIYGHKKFTEDIYQMTGYRPGVYWQMTWRYIGPAMMSILLVATVIKMFMKTPVYNAWDANKVNNNFLINYVLNLKFCLYEYRVKVLKLLIQVG